MWTVRDLIKTLEKFPSDLPVTIESTIPNEDYIGGYQEIVLDIGDILMDTNNKKVIITAIYNWIIQP